MEQVRTDQDAFTMFTYGIIGQAPPSLQNAVPPPPPPSKDKLTKWGVPRPPSPPGQTAASASTDDWHNNTWQADDNNPQQHGQQGRRRSASAPRQRYCHAGAQNGECKNGSFCKYVSTHTHPHGPPPLNLDDFDSDGSPDRMEEED